MLRGQREREKEREREGREEREREVGGKRWEWRVSEEPAVPKKNKNPPHLGCGEI